MSLMVQHVALNERQKNKYSELSMYESNNLSRD